MQQADSYLDCSDESETVRRTRTIESFVTPVRPEEKSQSLPSVVESTGPLIEKLVESQEEAMEAVPEESIMCNVCQLREAPNRHPVLKKSDLGLYSTYQSLTALAKRVGLVPRGKVCTDLSHNESFISYLH